MATDKKSFLLYCDIIHTIKKLDDNVAGELFKHILSYANGENPKTENMIIDLVFEPIKQSMIRDSEKYDNIVKRNRDNGLKGGRPKGRNNANTYPKKPSGLFGNPKYPKKADIDSVIDSEIDNVTLIEKDIKSKKNIIPDVNDVIAYFEEKGYSKNSAIKFYDYYSCADWKDSKGNKVKSWKQKAQSVWFKDENKITQVPLNVSHVDINNNGLIDLSKIWN